MKGYCNWFEKFIEDLFEYEGDSCKDYLERGCDENCPAFVFKEDSFEIDVD